MKRRTFIKITLPIALTGVLKSETLEKEKPVLSFGVIADPQYADAPPQGKRYYRHSIAKMNTAIEELNKHSLAFVTTIGDVIDRDLKSFKVMMPLYQKLKAPRRFVLGNHDYEVADNDKSKVMTEMGMKKAYYSEAFGDWHFIYLNGNDVSTYSHPKGSPESKKAEVIRQKVKKEGRPQSYAWNGGIGTTQMQWLEKELQTAQQKKKRIIIFNHFPVFPLSTAHNLWNDKEVVNLISACPNVIAYMEWP